MSEPNKHVRAAQAHLSHAKKPSFVDDTIQGLLVEIERLRAGIKRCHDACARPSMPRQSIGEMLAALTSPKESTGDAELDEVIEDHQNAEDLKWSDTRTGNPDNAD